MSFADYDNLCETIADWLARDDLSTQIADFVWLAECDIQRTVRFRIQQDKIAKGTTVVNQEWIQLPSDYAEGGLLRWESLSLPTLEVSSIDVTSRLQKTTALALSGQQVKVGFLWGDRVYVGPVPGSEAYELFYHSGVQHLGKNNPTNLILQEYPDTLLFGSLAASAPYLGADERLAGWATMYENAKEETRKAEWRARSSHGALRMRPDVRVW